jgi:hypothetical protein
VVTYRPSSCGGGAGSVDRTLFVFGDSHATAYLPIMDQLSAETGILVRVYTIAGCGFLDLMTPMKSKPTECLNFWQAASQAVLDEADSHDILFLPGLRLPRFIEAWAVKPVTEDELSYVKEARNGLHKTTQEALAWLQPFTGRGIDVIFEAPKPIFKSPPFRCSDWFNSINPICKGGLEQPRHFVEQLRAPILTQMHEIAAYQPGVHVWDPLPVLCAAESCSAFHEGRPLFFDADHLSAYGNSRLYPAFKAAVVALSE